MWHAQDALRESLGLAEPKLVKILRYLLDVHTNWFRKEQRCKDHFEGPLGIADLKVRLQINHTAANL